MADNSNRKPTPDELRQINDFINSPPTNIPSSDNYSNYSGYSNRPPTAEELRRINEFISGGSTNIYTEERPDFSNYVKPEYTPEPKPYTINIPAIPEIPDSYWAKPENIIKEYNNYRANPDLLEPEYGPDRKDISMAYDYLAQKNRGKPQTEWEPITVRDPLWQTVLSKWSDPTKPQTPEDQAIVDYTNEILTPPEPVGTWEELSPVGKIAKSLVGTGSRLEGEPGFTKITEAIIPAVGSFAPGYLGGLAVGAGLAAAGVVAGPAIGTIALVGGIGTALLQGINYVTGKDNPILNRVGNWLDIFSQSGEKAFVGTPAVIKSTHPEIDKNVEWGYTNPNLEARGFTKKPSYLGDAVDNFLDLAVEVVKMPFGESNITKEELESAWQVGAIGLEQNPFIANTALNIMNRIGGYETADYGEYYRYELGTNEPQAPTIPPDELNRALVQAVNVYNGLINPNTNKPYTSREIEDDILLRAATNQYGIAGALNDVIGQEVLDITNYMPPLMGAFGTVVGKATGNQNLVKAAQINRGDTVADIAPFPLNALSGKKQSGGITDLIDTYKKVLRGELTTNPPKVEDLSTFDRAMADITPEGKYAELQPGQATGKLAWVKNLSKLTEESKAILYTDDFANVVSELSLMSDSPVTWRENIMKMADMMEVKQGDSVAAIYGTAVQKTLSDGFRAIVESGTIDQITSKWQATEGLRSNLTVISSQLNLTPDEFIKLTRDQPNAAKSMIRDYAALNNNMIMNQVLTDDGTQIIDQFKVFTDKKDPLPYRFEQVATEYAVTITDQLSDYVVKVYNIQPQSLAIRLSDLMKRIQSVLLLGFSPSFPANNLINDVITRASVGVFGFPNSETWVDRMKIQTARMQESMSEFRGGIDQTQSPLTSVKEKINAKMHPGDSVDKLSALIGKASSKAPFSKLSGNIEAAESARANTVGQMQYMHYMWKPGRAIDPMDPVLESQIDAEIPNGSKLVYTALQNSLNKDEIRKNLYGDYVKPNAQSIMDSIVKENYPIDADTVNELFGKSGALVQLQTLLDNAKTPEEQAQAVEYIRGKMAATARIYMDNQVMHDAENIKNDVTAAGDRQQRIAKLFEYLDYLSDTRANQWINTRERYAGAYAKKLQESMTVTEWRNYISSVAAQNQAQWNTYYAHERQAYTGILRGLGLNDDVTARYSNYVLDYQNNWKEFYDLQRQNIKKYYDGDLTWDDYIADMDQAYEDHFQNELLIQDKMNNLFLQAYHESLGLDTTELKSLMDQIIEVRNDMHNMQLDIRQRTRNMTDDLKNEAYLEFETDYNSRIAQIAQLHDKINEILGTDPAELRRKQSGQPVKDAPPVEPLSNFERAATFVRNEYEAEVTDNIRDQAEANFQKTIDTDEVDTGEYSIPEEEPPEFIEFTQKNFDYGFPVTIQELKLMELDTQTDLIATPESDLRSFELVPEYTGAEFYLDKLYAKKVNAYQLGDYVITAHIYDGDKLAALYANLPMKEIKVTGKTIDVLGIDPEDQNKFVFAEKDIVIKVDPAKDIPKDFAVEEQPNIPNGQHKQPPLNMPTGEAYAELMNKYVHPILDQFLPRYKQELINNKNAKHFSKLSEPAKIALENYVDDISNKLAITKYNAIKYGEMKRDQALLNYNKRYGFDTYLTVISPYQFWYTRTMINWAKRMIDRPVWYTTYYRLKQKEELFARDDIPARLDGRFRINMPYLEDWMGGAFYTDVLSQLFPFAQFINRGEYYMNSQNQLIKNTEYLLKEQLDEGIIGAQEYLDAVKNRNNTAWKAAYAETTGNEQEDPMLGGLFQQYLSLPFLVDWYIKKSRGREKEIFNLPITRTGLTLQTLLKETPLEPVGNIVGQALTLPEQGLRKLYDIDYNELGTYGDYAIKKQISQMGNAGEISREEMLDAQRSMSGPIYEEAYRRQREELMLATQGAAAIDAMTEFLKGNASFTDVLRALFVAPFSGKIYPKDEQELRQQNKLRQQAYADQDSGKKPDAVSEFYEQYPAYIGRTASFMDDPEKLNKYVAYQQITDMYYSLPYAEQVAIRDALGPDFYNAIINKETRNYKAVPYEDLLTWEYAIRGDNPNIPASAIIKANAPKIQYFTPEVVQVVDEWSAIENTKYKGIKEIQNAYYALPKSERKAYLIAHPELQSYWDEKHSYEAAHPELVEFKDIQSSMYDEIMAANCFAEMSDSVMSDLEYTTITGAKLRPASVTKLKYLYEKYADPSFDTFDEFVEKLRRYK